MTAGTFFSGGVQVHAMAEEQGDYFVVNGSKIWTSQAHRTDWMFLLCRTDSTQPGSRRSDVGHQVAPG